MHIFNTTHHSGLGRFLSLYFSVTVCAFAIDIPSEPISKLASEDFRIREIAQADLLAWARLHGEDATDGVYKLSRNADDPEVRNRCLDILRELVNDDYLKNGEGFIGIQMKDEMMNVPGDPKQRGVIRVVFLAPDSPGQKAGLQLNDLIVGIGDEVWHDENVLFLFREKIKKYKPDTKIVLKVLRDGNVIQLEVKLGRRPIMPDNPFFAMTREDQAEAEAAAKEAYFRRWLDQKKVHN